MKEYREPNILRAAAEAFNADDTDQGYRLLDENQKATENQLMRPGTLYRQSHTGITVGAAMDLITFRVTKNVYTTVWWYVDSYFFTSATLAISPAADSGLDTRLSPFVGYVGRWDTSQDVTVSIGAGWGWSGGAGPVDFEAYAAVLGGSRA